jgi:hypothetical protein
MSAGITIDPQQLNNFASGIQELITNLKSAKSLTDKDVALPPVKFGQDASYPAGLQPTFPPALMLHGQMQDHISEFTENFTTLINKLTLLADTATAIAKNYATAAEIDDLSASAVSGMLDLPIPTSNG